jgi:hypothetical protein
MLPSVVPYHMQVGDRHARERVHHNCKIDIARFEEGKRRSLRRDRMRVSSVMRARRKKIDAGTNVELCFRRSQASSSCRVEPRRECPREELLRRLIDVSPKGFQITVDTRRSPDRRPGGDCRRACVDRTRARRATGSHSPCHCSRRVAPTSLDLNARGEDAEVRIGLGGLVPVRLSRWVSGAPAEWYEGARAAGPLASYDARDTWVSHPHRAGVVLIGDAAASNDPSWGCGLSLTLRDVRVLADKLLASDDWSGAADSYAEEHDRHYGVIHRLTGWARTLFYNPGLIPAAERESAITRLLSDRTRGFDIVGIGPDSPCDEATRRCFFGED